MRFNLPVKYKCEVIAVTRDRDNYLVQTNDINYAARNVVVATGFFQDPKVPQFF